MSLRSALSSFTPFFWLFLGALAVGVIGCGHSETEPDTSKSPTAKTDGPPSESSPSTKTPDQAVKPSVDNTKTKTKAPSQSPPAKTPEESDRPARQRTVTNDPESQLKADLADAISLLENGDVASLIEDYMPLDYVENIREFSTIEQMAENIKTGGLFQKEWLKKLRAMQKGDVVFADEEKSIARFEVEIGGGESAPSHLKVPNPAEEEAPESSGFEGDLKTAIGEAVAALEAKDYRKFIENMFPPAALYVARSDESLDGLLLRMKEHPQMVEQMLADLKVLQKLDPQMNEQETVATFQLNAGSKQERSVRLEKAGTWRFANTAQEFRTQVYRQSQQPPIAVKKTLNTEWIRVRDHWRLSEID